MKIPILLILALCWASSIEAKVRIVTTTPDLAALAKALGGDRVEVKSISRGYQDPHYVQAKPSYMRLLNRADLLIYTGLELEVGWLPLLIQGARNPKVTPGAVGHLDASKSIRPLEIPEGEIDRSMGDIHPRGNPHYLLNPHNGFMVSRAIADRLSKIDAEGADTYSDNLARFQESLIRKIAEWESRTAPWKGIKIVTYHKQWEYFADWLGLQILDQVENKPGIPPSPRHLSGLVDRMAAENIPVLLCANFIDPGTARRVTGRTGANLLLLPVSVGGEPQITAYPDLFDVLIDRLAETMSGS